MRHHYVTEQVFDFAVAYPYLGTNYIQQVPKTGTASICMKVLVRMSICFFRAQTSLR